MLVTSELSKRYGRVQALENCNLTVANGEVFGLLGPNGSGKTTLLRIILGFLRPTAGFARLGELDCYRQSLAVHRQVTYMPGEARLFPHMRGRGILEFFAEIHPAGDLARALRMAERLGMDLSRRVWFCSSGMRQKLAVIAALSPRSNVVILDEPTSNLDPTARQEVLHLVGEAQREGRTVIFSSHVMSEVEQVCDRTCILRYGTLVHTQVMSELRRQHRIHALLHGSLPRVPDMLADGLQLEQDGPGKIIITTPGDLRNVLGWLASLPLAEVRVEPIGLQAIYDKFHLAEVA